MEFRSRKAKLLLVGALCVSQTFVGCAKHQARPSITAVGLSPANRCEPHGIPYYLPKPLLVVAKNVRHIDESKVGLTGPAPIPGGFDNQAAYADIKANVTVPSSSGSSAAAAGSQAIDSNANISGATLGENQAQSFVAESMTPAANANFDDGLEVDSFFTYQIVFVPDLTQKYGLRISGGAGEIRAAMNLVNGWMYTGMGPYYFKDSSSAQNAMATGVGAMYAGRGVSDVVNSVGNVASRLTKAAGNESGLSTADMQQLSQQMQMLDALAQSTPKVPQQMLNYAEIYIYEPVLMGDQTEWRLVTEHHFDRQYFDNAADTTTAANKGKLMDFLIESMRKSGTQEGGLSNASSQSNKKVDLSLTTPAGSTFRLLENGAVVAPQGGQEGALAPVGPAAQPQAPAGKAKDAGAALLDPNLDQTFVGGTSTETADYYRNAAMPGVATVPQVEVNVMTDRAAPRPASQPLADSLPRLHRFFHREPATIVQRQGNNELTVDQAQN